MPRLSTICRYCFSDGVPRRSLVVALLVGTILNLINQGDAVFAGASIHLTKILLTYVVPYCVATYGAVSSRLNMDRPDRPPAPTAAPKTDETGARSCNR